MTEPLKISDQDIEGRKNQTPLSFTLAQCWNKYMPRGKGWMPRFIGKTFSDSLANCNITTKNDIKFAISPRSLDVYTAIYNDGKWDKHVFTTCKAVLKKGDVFYDLGANIGAMSLMLAKIYGDDVTIYAFEPQPDLAHALAISAKLNNFHNIYVYEAMLGAHEGKAELFFSEHSVHASGMARDDQTGSIKRDVCSIDKMVEKNIIKPPSVIKIDIEGGELAAFKGAANTIRAHAPKIIFENDANTERFGYKREDILTELKSYADYEFFYINRHDFSLIPVDESGLDYRYTDILAAPRA